MSSCCCTVQDQDRRSSLGEGGALQYRDESPQLWGRLGTRRVGTGERSSNNSGKEPLDRRFISGKPEGIVDGQLNLTGLEWPNIKTEEYLCAMLKADVNLMSAGSEVKRRGAKQRLIIYSRLFTHDRRSPSWGVNNMAWPQISGDAAQLLHLLHCSAPDSAFKNRHAGGVCGASSASSGQSNGTATCASTLWRHFNRRVFSLMYRQHTAKDQHSLVHSSLAALFYSPPFKHELSR